MKKEIIDTGIKDNVLGYLFSIDLLKNLLKKGLITNDIVERGSKYFKEFYRISERDIAQTSYKREVSKWEKK